MARTLLSLLGVYFSSSNIYLRVCFWCEELFHRQGPSPHNSLCLSFFQRILLRLTQCSPKVCPLDVQTTLPATVSRMCIWPRSRMWDSDQVLCPGDNAGRGRETEQDYLTLKAEASQAPCSGQLGQLFLGMQANTSLLLWILVFSTGLMRNGDGLLPSREWVLQGCAAQAQNYGAA